MLQLWNAINRRIFRFSGVNRRNCSGFDIVGRVKVRLTGTKTDDILACGFEFHRFLRHGHGRRGANAGQGVGQEGHVLPLVKTASPSLRMRLKFDQATIAKGYGMNESVRDWYAPEIATFGDRLTAAREAANMSQDALAKRLGVKKSTLRGWEDDLAEPRANRLSMMAGLLNVSMMWLINGEGEGVDTPDEDPLPGDIKDIILEVREIKSDLQAKAQQMARLEKRLRRMVGGDT